MIGSDTVILPGGKGANTAVAAARLGVTVALLGAVGTDQHGDLLVRSLREAGVYTDLLRRTDRPTGVAYVMVTPDGENSILVSPGANDTLSVDDIDVGLGEPRVLVASLEVPPATVEHAVDIAARRGIRAVVNLSPIVDMAPRTLACLDPLVVNEHEAAQLLGGDDLDPRSLLELGPRSVVVTLGSRGVVVASAKEVCRVVAPEVEVVDTTGAGDAFTGALATRLAAGDELAEAARFAVRVAAMSVTRRGAQPSYPTAEELGETH